MGLRYVRYEFHHNFREMSSVVISRRTKDCFGTSHLFRGPHIVSRGGFGEEISRCLPTEHIVGTIEY